MSKIDLSAAFPGVPGTEQIRVILHAKRLGPADQVPIEHVFTIENHIVPLDRADVLE